MSNICQIFHHHFIQMRLQIWRLYMVITPAFYQKNPRNIPLRVIKNWNLLFVICLELVICDLCFARSVHAASFKISPSSGVTFKQNCQSSLDVLLDTENGVSNAADIILNYDNTKIEVTEIRPGNVYPNYFGNVIDQNAGILRLTGANFTSTLNGHGVFATILFKPKVNTGTSYLNIRFTGADKYNSLDSNIADAVTSNDLLTSIQNGFFALSSGNCVTDSIPPTITFVSPTNNQTGVPSTANILVDVADYSSGVDINSVTITINGVVYPSNNSRISYTGSPSFYHFTLHPIDPLYPDSINTLQVSAADLTGNSVKKTINFNLPAVPPPTPITCPVIPETTPAIIMITPTLPFRSPEGEGRPTPPIIDTNSPSIDFLDPRSKDIIALRPVIKFRVIDDTAINFNSLKVTLNDQVFTFDNPLFSKTGTSKEAIFTLKIDKPLLPHTPYTLSIFIADTAGNGLSQSISVTTTDTLVNQFSRVVSSINPVSSVTTSPSYGLRITVYGLLILIILYLLSKLLSFLTLKEDHPYGLVFDALTHEPINHARVIIKYGTVSNRSLLTYTNIFGIFAAKLPPGKYDVTISAPNYTSATTSFTTKTDFDTYLNIPLKPVKTLPSSKYSLTPRHGYVVDKHGNPQTFLKLTLKETKFDAIVTTRVTDKLGRYRFIVPHGRYQIIIEGYPHSGFVVDTRHKISGYLAINKDIIV